MTFKRIAHLSTVVAMAASLAACATTQTAPVVHPAKAPVVAAAAVTAPALSDVLPFYRVDAPASCLEDMACWNGSAADGRSDAEVRDALWDDVSASLEAYPEDMSWMPLPEAVYSRLGVSDDEFCLRRTGTVYVVCSDGQVFSS